MILFWWWRTYKKKSIFLKYLIISLMIWIRSRQKRSFENNCFRETRKKNDEEDSSCLQRMKSHFIMIFIKSSLFNCITSIFSLCWWWSSWLETNFLYTMYVFLTYSNVVWRTVEMVYVLHYTYLVCIRGLQPEAQSHIWLFYSSIVTLFLSLSFFFF